MATGSPNTIQMLKMLLPMMFPTKMSCSFFMAEIIEVTNSGSEVPKAMMVKEITLSDTPRVLAILVALFTTRSLPKTIPASPRATNSNDFNRPYWAFSPSSSILFLEMEMM